MGSVVGGKHYVTNFFLTFSQSYDCEFLKVYPELEPTPFQLEEDLEQLKILENGYKIKVLSMNLLISHSFALFDVSYSVYLL